MAGTKEIRTRIKSVQQTLKITNAMYLISSANLRKAKGSWTGRPLLHQNRRHHCGHSPPVPGAGARVFDPRTDAGAGAEGGLYRGQRRQGWPVPITTMYCAVRRSTRRSAHPSPLWWGSWAGSIFRPGHPHRGGVLPCGAEPHHAAGPGDRGRGGPAVSGPEPGRGAHFVHRDGLS